VRGFLGHETKDGSGGEIALERGALQREGVAISKSYLTASEMGGTRPKFTGKRGKT